VVSLKRKIFKYSLPQLDPLKLTLPQGFGIQAKQIMESSRSSMKETEHREVFHDILDSKLPLEEKDFNRFANEGILLVSAGTRVVSSVAI